MLRSVDACRFRFRIVILVVLEENATFGLGLLTFLLKLIFTGFCFIEISHSIEHAICRPAKSSDKAEDIPLLGSIFFKYIRPFRFIFKFFRVFSLNLLVIANIIHRHIEVLLFGTIFVISVLFGDVKTEEISSFCITGRYNFAIGHTLRA